MLSRVCPASCYIATTYTHSIVSIHTDEPYKSIKTPRILGPFQRTPTKKQPAKMDKSKQTPSIKQQEERRDAFSAPSGLKRPEGVSPAAWTSQWTRETQDRKVSAGLGYAQGSWSAIAK